MSTATVTTGTFRDFVRLHVKSAASGKEAYFLAVQLVYDNDFTPGAKQSFPQMRVDFSELSQMSWARRLKCWFDNHLTPAEQKMFLKTEFIWP